MMAKSQASYELPGANWNLLAIGPKDVGRDSDLGPCRRSQKLCHQYSGCVQSFQNHWPAPAAAPMQPPSWGFMLWNNDLIPFKKLSVVLF